MLGKILCGVCWLFYGDIFGEGDIPKPVWAVGFALEQTLHVVALAVFSYVDFK
ncbi:MAG: hypothetical protein LBH59_03120 [Planctomycetaceae bacterium]|nr:hypothetical protein [Planctomycetaceae bacterium]